MPSPPTLDVEALLRPIAGDSPAGESLRYAGVYDAIQEARRADDNLDRGEWVRDTKAADWQAVIGIATEALMNRSKDLQIAVWLVEALLKRHGFPGLRDGLRLLRELQERFWESLYPELEADDDIEFRAAPLEWLNAKLSPSVLQLPVTHSGSGETYSWLHWEESRGVDNLGRRDAEAMQAALADGKIVGEQFDKAVQSTPLTYYQTLFDDLNLIGETYRQLDQCIDAKFGREAPSLLDLKQAIVNCRTLVEDILKKRGALKPEPVTPTPDMADIPAAQERACQEEAGTMTHHVPSTPVGAPVAALTRSLEPQDRADALRRLTAVAEYFRRTEPHNPVAYLIQRAVRWGKMPLAEWLPYVIRDETVLDSVRETLGLNDARHDPQDAYASDDEADNAQT